MLDRFHPAVRGWFEETLGTPMPPHERGEHVLIAAPTSSGKTLAAFLWALDQSFRQGPWLAPV